MSVDRGAEAAVPGGRRRAVEAVIARMDELRPPLSPYALATRAGVDRGTIAKFLAHERWPQLAKRTAIERALGWPTGTIEAVAAGGQPPAGEQGSRPTVRRIDGDLVEFLTDTERDLSDTQREIWMLELRAYARRRAEEIKRDL